MEGLAGRAPVAAREVEQERLPLLEGDGLGFFEIRQPGGFGEGGGKRAQQDEAGSEEGLECHGEGDFFLVTKKAKAPQA